MAKQEESLIALLKAIDEKLPWDCGNKECWQQNNEHDTCHDGRVCAKRRLRAFIAGHPFGEPAPVKSWTQKSGIPTPEEFVRSSKLGRESRHLWGWSGKNIGIMVEGLQNRIRELESQLAGKGDE